nr:DUF3307 domain-containing protein [Kibdelosporangium phytohabitans]
MPALLVAHHVADHWAQTPRQAARKGDPGWSGRRACAGHVTTYTAVTAGLTGLLWWLFDLTVTWGGFLAGQLVSAVTHYVVDRRVPLAWLARRVGKGEMLEFGAPRPGRDDNPHLGTGAYALDQSWHWWWLLVTAMCTAVI